MSNYANEGYVPPFEGSDDGAEFSSLIRLRYGMEGIRFRRNRRRS